MPKKLNEQQGYKRMSRQDRTDIFEEGREGEVKEWEKNECHGKSETRTRNSRHEKEDTKGECERSTGHVTLSEPGSNHKALKRKGGQR